MNDKSKVQPSLTDLIHLAASGVTDTKEELYARVYEDLRAAAHGILRRERNVGELQTTALVNEVVLRFEKSDALSSMANRRVFFSVAIRAMNQILVDHYRRRTKLVDSPDRSASPLEESVRWIEEEVGFDFEKLQIVLEALAKDSPRQHAVVMHRFFGGLTIRETAELLGVSDQTVERDWRLARAKLVRHLRKK